MRRSLSNAGIVWAALLVAPGELMKPTVRPDSVSRLKGGALLEHVWDAEHDDLVVPAFSLLREKMSQSGGDLLTLAR